MTRDITDFTLDLKMENILINGFDNETPGSGENLVTKIADLGMGISSPLLVSQFWGHEESTDR